jgi:lipoprotein-anchoring transpeptidase ErfK/SrfK
MSDAVAAPVEAPPTGTRVAAVPQGEAGTPVLEAEETTPLEDETPGDNDLQKRIAALGGELGDTARGRNEGDAVYVSAADAGRMIEADWRWNPADRSGLLITDGGLVRLTADSSRVTVNEEPQRLSGPPRVLGGQPHLPVRALVDLYGASVKQDDESGLTRVTLGEKTFSVAVPERLFQIEICRGERWLKVFYGGKLAKEYPICSGAGDNTPVGHFHIQNKAVWPSWRAYWGELMPGGSPRNPLGARWLGTTARGRVTGWPIGIHGTNQPSSIGQRISGGCIRTYNHFSIELYETIPIGTPVWIHE